MKATHYFRFTALAAALVPVAIACSEGNGDRGPDGPDATPSVPLPAEDGGVAAGDADSSSDASADSDVTQPKPTCTDEGWCHTVVPDGQTLRDLWADGQGVVWTVSEQGNVLRWDGTAWVQSHAAGVPLYAIWGSSPTDLWAGGGAPTTGNVVLPGTLLHGTGTSASTITWTAVPAPVTVRSIWGTSATNVWAAASLSQRVRASDPSFVLHYSGPAADPDAADAAAGWEIDPVSTAFPTHFEKVWGTSSDDVWLTGRVAITTSTAKGRVLHRRPDGSGGFTWRQDQPTTTDRSRADTFGFSVSPSLAFLVAFSSDSSGRAYYHMGLSNDEGATFTWTQHATSETGFIDNALSTLWATGPNDLWIAGQRGRLRHWDGVQWRVAAVALDDVMPVQKAVYAISGTGPDNVWVVGADIALRKVPPSKM
jgi:hypothetical protein